MISIFLLGFIFQVVKSLTCLDPKYPYLVSSGTKCVALCSDENEYSIETTPNTCIKKDTCTGYYLDNNIMCLTNSCQNLLTTQQKPAVNLLAQTQGKTWRACVTCTSQAAFLSYSFKPDIPASCFSCNTQNLIEDYTTSKCSRMEDLKDGFLDYNKKKFFPFTSKCPNGQYLVTTKNYQSTNIIKQCIYCPPSLPLSSEDGTYCHRTCPEGKIADETSRSCVNADGFTCKGQLSYDKKMCSSGCPAGEIKDALNVGNCIQCPTSMPFRNEQETQCLLKCSSNNVYHTKLNRCVNSLICDSSGLYISSDGKTCGELCKEGEDFGYYICLDFTNKYRSQLTLKYVTCTEKCPKNEFGDPKTMTCKPYSECSQFITGKVPFCSDTCQRDEFIVEKFSDKQVYTECTICDNGFFKYIDPSSGLGYCISSPCSMFDLKQNCMNECKNNQFLSEFYEEQCQDTCYDKFHSFQLEKPKCSTYCNFGIKSYEGKKKFCNKSCKQGEIAFDRSIVSYEQDFVCTTGLCPSNYKLYTFQKQVYCSKTCYILSINKKDCVEKCEEGQFAVEEYSSDNKFLVKYKCQKSCSKRYSYKFQDSMICSDVCRAYLSVDQNTCGSSCKAGEFALNRNYQDLNQTYARCTNSCTGYVFIDENGILKCIYRCNLYLLPDKKICQNSCPKDQYALERTYYQEYEQCSLTCETFGYTDDKGVKRCAKYCPFILQTDQKTCSKSCQNGEYVNDKTHTTPYYTCSPKCSDFEYYLDDSIKRCTKICPDNYVESFSNQQKICIKRYDCKDVISVDNKKCIEKCDENKREYPSILKKAKQCTVCNQFFIVQSGIANCLNDCPDNLIGLPQKNKCVSQEQSIAECDKLKLSADKKKCTQECEYPDIVDSKGQCKKACSPSDQSCQQCNQNEVSLSIESYEVCIPKEKCVDYISSDGKRCIPDCSFIFEIQQDNSKICASCQFDEVVVKTYQKLQCLKKSISNIFSLNLSYVSTISLSFYDSRSKLETMKKVHEDLTIQLFEQLKQEYAPVQEFFQQYILGLYRMLQGNTSPQLNTGKQVIGSKNTIITITQKSKDGYKFKNQFNLESIQNGTEDLLEEILDKTTEVYPQLQTTVFTENPCCKSENCKYPLFYLFKIEQTQNRILQVQQQSSRQFTVTFNIDKPDQIKKYACVSYDLSDISKKPTQMQAAINDNNKSITCVVETNVLILLDTKCEFIDKSNCPTPITPIQEDPKDKNGTKDQDTLEAESDDGLSAGAIAGIAIGASALVIIFVLVGFYMYKKKNIRKAQEFYKATNQESSPGGSPKYEADELKNL